DQIRRSPDKNTSEVLKRVSGTSIQDNKFVIVRGLADRYNTTTLNNSSLPSSEPDRKAFSFDIVPSNLVDNVIINKTAQPDLPGDFSGGVVQISTKDFPEENFLSLSYGTTVNSQSSFSPMMSGARGKYDWLGFGSAKRQLPDNFPSKTRYNNLNNSQKFALSQDFNNSWGIAGNSQGLPTQNFQLTYGNSKQFANDHTFGSIFSVTYRYSEGLGNSDRSDFDRIGAVYNYQDRLFKYSANLGGIANFAYGWKSNKIALKTLYNKLFDDQLTYRTGSNYDAGEVIRGNSMYLLERSLFSSQLQGDHAFGEKKWKLNWNLNYGLTIRNEPDFRRMTYFKLDSEAQDPAVPYRAKVQTGSVDPRNAGRFYSDLYENLFSGATSFSLPVKIFDQKGSFKAGLSSQYKIRDFSARVMGVKVTQNFDQALLTLPQDEIFAPENFREGGFVIDEITNPDDKYTAGSFLNTGYLMMDNRFSEKLRAVYGFRVEHYSQFLDTRNRGLKKISIENEALNFLPSLNLTYAVNDKSNMRLSYSNTVSRPEFRELAPFSFYDFTNASSVQGNPELKISNISNFDVRYELFPSAGQIFSVSAFYKYFKNPIEQYIPAGLSGVNRVRSFQNADHAINYGAEFEVRKNLGSVLPWAKGVTAFSNVSLIKSKVEVPVNVNASGERALQGQSPYLINAGLQYNAPQNKFGAGILYNVVGRRIFEVGNVDYEDVYEAPRNLLDLQFNMKVMRSRGELKFNVSDLLNQNSLFYQDMNENKKFDQADNRLSTLRQGTNYGLTFSYTIK
ncbi:MAG TPA: TonB-dependent receptor, partial [Sphingobacteriaceae bacterium]